MDEPRFIQAETIDDVRGKFHYSFFTNIRKDEYREAVYDMMEPVKDWCTQQFGPTYHYKDNRDGQWRCIWEAVYFRREADAAAFKLRWA